MLFIYLLFSCPVSHLLDPWRGFVTAAFFRAHRVPGLRGCSPALHLHRAFQEHALKTFKVRLFSLL